MGECCVIDVTKKVKPRKVKPNNDYQITADDIREWERWHGSVYKCIVIFRTGFELYWDRPAMYLGRKDGKSLHFPGIGPDAARYLVGREIKAVGLDTASLDNGQSKYFTAHKTFFQSNIPGMENLRNLEDLPPRGSFIIALPMLIEGGSGGPTRVVHINC